MGIKGFYLYDGNYDYILKQLQFFDISYYDISSSDISSSTPNNLSQISSNNYVWLNNYFSSENIQSLIDSINYNLETTSQINSSSDISSIIDIIKDISFNKNFYNDPSFNINDEINPIYLKYPYNFVTRNSICIEHNVYYRITNIKTVEDISINTDTSCNMCNMYDINKLCCYSYCRTCKGTGIKIICDKCDGKGWYYDCSYCDENHIITDPSMYDTMYQNLLSTTNAVDTSTNAIDTSTNAVDTSTNAVDTNAVDTNAVDTSTNAVDTSAVDTDILDPDLTTTDTSMVFYCNCPKIDCSICNSRGLLYSDIKYTDISSNYSIFSNLEIEVSVYKKRDVADIFTNRNKIDTYFFKKPTNKSDDQENLWEKSYIYIKPLIEEKLYNQIQSCELFKYLDLSSNLQDV